MDILLSVGLSFFKLGMKVFVFLCMFLLMEKFMLFVSVSFIFFLVGWVEIGEISSKLIVFVFKIVVNCEFIYLFFYFVFYILIIFIMRV